MPSSKPPVTDPKTDRTPNQKPAEARAVPTAKQTPNDYQFTDFASI